MATTSYNRVIRKMVIGFGNLFDNITLVRYNPNLTEQERFIVPLAYSAKEKYVQRLQGDPNLDKKIQMALPRMSFEMVGLTYDSSRKQLTNWKNFSRTANAGVVSQYNPVPYNFDFNLYIYVRNIEDGTQIIEHIVPFFTPDYTIKLNLIPEMGIVKEVPIILNTATHETVYEGNAESETRTIIWTLNFTVKGFIFGNVNTSGNGLITHSITNILSDITSTDNVSFNMGVNGTGQYKVGELVYQGYSAENSSASGKVTNWFNNVLTLAGIQGNFVSNQPIIGLDTNANYVFTSYEIGPELLVRIDVTPNPPNANANSNYTYTTTITEYDN